MVHGYAQVSTLISVLKHDISAFLKKRIVISYLLDGSGVIEIGQAGPGGNSHSGEYLHSLRMVVLCFLSIIIYVQTGATMNFTGKPRLNATGQTRKTVQLSVHSL